MKTFLQKPVISTDSVLVTCYNGEGCISGFDFFSLKANDVCYTKDGFCGAMNFKGTKTAQSLCVIKDGFCRR